MSSAKSANLTYPPQTNGSLSSALPRGGLSSTFASSRARCSMRSPYLPSAMSSFLPPSALKLPTSLASRTGLSERQLVCTTHQPIGVTIHYASPQTSSPNLLKLWRLTNKSPTKVWTESAPWIFCRGCRRPCVLCWTRVHHRIARAHPWTARARR